MVSGAHRYRPSRRGGFRRGGGSSDGSSGDVVRSARQRRREAAAVLRFAVRLDVRRHSADQLRSDEHARRPGDSGRRRAGVSRHAVVDDVLHRDARRDRVAHEGAGPRRPRRDAADRDARRDARHLRRSRGTRDWARRGKGTIALMRRADRLFQIIQLLRRRRTVTTAAQIASKLEVSERTVYSDIRDLVLAGTPIDGEAGVGYRIRPGYDLPPLMFDRDEIQALVLGARIVSQFGDPALARAADAILGKVAAILPKDLAPLVADTRLYVPTIVGGKGSADGLAIAREALVSRR